MNTPEPMIDVDLIAAFIDGRLTPAERERALHLLTHSDEAFEIFADALRVQGDAAGAKVLPIVVAPSWRRLRRWSVVVPAVAAAALLIAVLPRLRGSHGERAFAPHAEAIVGQLAQRPDLLRMAATNGWEQRDWSVMRGASSALADSARDFRLGVRTVDLQVAVAIDDRQLADRLTAEMLGWIGPLQFSQVVASKYTDLRAEIASAQARERIVGDASQAEAKLGELLDSFWFGFGKWCAGGELAARGHLGAFFQSNLTAGVIRDALEVGRGKLAQDDVAALRQAAALARPGVADDEFDRVRNVLRLLIKRHGG